MTGLRSIAYGVIAGIFAYLLLNGIPWAIGKATNYRLMPPTYNQAETWVVPPGGIVPPWAKFIMERVGNRQSSGSGNTNFVMEEQHHQRSFGSQSMAEGPHKVVDMTDEK